MPNICENTIQINGTKEDFDKFLKDTEDMGYEGRFNIEEQNIPTINIVKAKPMPEEFDLISTGANNIEGKSVNLWWYRSKVTGEIERNDIFSKDDIGLLKAIGKNYYNGIRPSMEKAEKLSHNWQPWRTLASWYLWRSIDPNVVSY